MYQLTPLQLAIVNGHYTLAKRLIERGVGVDDGSLYLRSTRAISVTTRSGRIRPRRTAT